LKPYTAGRGSQREARIDHGPIAMITPLPSMVSPSSSITPPMAPDALRINPVTVPRRISAPFARAALINPFVKARGSTSAVVSGEPIWPVTVTPGESHGRPVLPRLCRPSAA
jgi:hypothetical protein